MVRNILHNFTQRVDRSMGSIINSGREKLFWTRDGEECRGDGFDGDAGVVIW